MISRKSSKPSTGDASDHLQLATIVLDALTLPYHALFYYYPLFGGRGNSAAALSITFVSQASLDAGLQKRLRSLRQLQPVRQTRIVGKKDMLFNDAMPPVRVHPLTHEVTINGEKIGIEPLSSVRLSRLYIVS